MKYLILSIFIIFCFIYSFNCEDCNNPKFKKCRRVNESSVNESNIFRTFSCCMSHYKKNSSQNIEPGKDEICTEEIVYCCPFQQRNNLSNIRCKNSLEIFLSKKTILPSFPHKPTTTTKNHGNTTLNGTIIEVLTPKVPQTPENYHKVHNKSITTKDYNSIEMKNVAKPYTSRLNATNESHLTSTNLTEVDQILEIDEHKKLNQTSSNRIDGTANEIPKDKDHISATDITKEQNNLIGMKNNETTKKPQILENSTTTIELTNATKTVTENITTSCSTQIPQTTPGLNTTTVHQMTKSEQKCAEYGLSTVQKISIMGLIGHKPREVTIDKCRHKAIALVIGGREAMPYEFPHQALLGYEYNDRLIWKCGGALVSRNFILTAAHCIYDYDLGSVKVVKLGMFNQFEDSAHTIIRNVASYIEHPDYDRINRIDDIGLLKLDDFVPLNEYINPICLPTKQPEHKTAIGIGFGATETSHRSKRLMKVVLEQFEPHIPSRIRNETHVDKFIFFGHRTQRKDTCSGDSGSPLQVSNDMNVKCSYTQIGIVSYGPNECGIPGLPAVYVNVFYYIDWIQKYIWEDEDRLQEFNKP